MSITRVLDIRPFEGTEEQRSANHLSHEMVSKEVKWNVPKEWLGHVEKPLPSFVSRCLKCGAAENSNAYDWSCGKAETYNDKINADKVAIKPNKA